MITNHSAATYSLAMHARYRMPEFETVKFHPSLACHYSIAHTRHFKRVIVDTECSPVFHYETWLDGVYYAITMPSVSYPIGRRPKSLNVNLAITVMHDVTYTDYMGSINDENVTPKDGVWTPSYMLTYAQQVFDIHKHSIAEALHRGDLPNNATVRVYQESAIRDVFHP